jgi:hypothetical protein
MEYAWAYARLQFGEGSRRAEQWTSRVAADLKAGQVHAVLARLHQLHPRAPDAAPLAALADQDAGCAEALWALDQPAHTLDLATMVRDTTATLTRLPHTRQQVRDALPLPTRDRVTQLERRIHAALDAREAYNDIPGHDPQHC